MTKEEMIAKILEIGSTDSIEEVRASLGEFQAALSTDYDTHMGVVNERDRLSNDNETLRSANMKLFTQLGVKDKPDDTIEEKPKRKFEDLFDAKGGLK